VLSSVYSLKGSPKTNKDHASGCVFHRWREEAIRNHKDTTKEGILLYTRVQRFLTSGGRSPSKRKAKKPFLKNKPLWAGENTEKMTAEPKKSIQKTRDAGGGKRLAPSQEEKSIPRSRNIVWVDYRLNKATVLKKRKRPDQI